MFLILSILPLKAQSLLDKAILLRNQAQYDSTLYLLNEALDRNKPMKNDSLQALFLLERGKTYQLVQRYELALDDFNKALSRSVEVGNADGEMKAYVYLAEFYRHLFDYKVAKKFIEFAQKLESNTKVSPLTLAQFYNRKAAILAETDGTIKDVRYLSERAIAIAKKYNYHEIEVISLNELGHLYNADTLGLHYYKRALAILSEHKDIRTQVDVLINISRFYQNKSGLYGLGIDYARQGLELCKGTDWFYAMRELYYIIATCYRLQENYKMANESLDSVLKYTEEHLKKKYEKEIKDVETKYEVARKDLVLANQKKKTESLEQENLSKNQRLRAITIITLLLILFSVFSIYAVLRIRRTNKKLTASNIQKDVLIQEVHHRVKNNFQVISGLMNMQLKNISDIESRKVFQEAVQRIHSMALIHQQLYSGENIDRVKIVEFLNQILNVLTPSDLREKDFFSITGDDPSMHIEQAIPLGMIVHELTTNSIKYAWDSNQDKKIDIRIEHRIDSLNIIYRDNGKGLPPKLDIKETKSLGLKLVDLFSHKQLMGTLICTNNNGAHFDLTFTLR